MITLIDKPPKVCLSENPAIVKMSSDISGYINQRLIVDFAFPGIAYATASDRLYVSSNEVVQIDISEYLRSVYFAQRNPSVIFTIPEYGKPWAEVPDICKKYSVFIRERSDDGPANVDLNIEDRWVLPGKIPVWMNQEFYSKASSFWNWINGTKPFLTFAPSLLPTTKAQVQKLYWLCFYVPFSGNLPELKINLHFSDGTTAEYNKSGLTGTLKQFSVYQFFTGYTALDIQTKVDADYPGKEVIAYDITVMDISAVSKTQSYYLNTFEHEAEHQLAFKNSFGVFDTIMLTGEASMEREYSSEMVKVHNPTRGMPLQRNIRSEVTEKVKASTGWLSSERRLYLAELLNSSEVYEIVGNKLFPVAMLKQTVGASRDNEELQAETIEYQRVQSYFTERED